MMYYSLLQYVPTDSEKFINTGREDAALRAAAIEMSTSEFRVGILCASDAHDDCVPTHVIADGVVYRMVAVESEVTP